MVFKEIWEMGGFILAKCVDFVLEEEHLNGNLLCGKLVRGSSSPTSLVSQREKLGRGRQ